MPTAGRAIFAQQPLLDTQRRLAYAPLNADPYYETHATLGQYIAFKHPDTFNELETAVKNLLGGAAGPPEKQAIKTIFDKLKKIVPVRFENQINKLGNGGKDDYEQLIFGKLRFIGICVEDNLSNADRRWWSQTGIVQITTCVQGVATVVVTTEDGHLAAFEIFAPLEPAVWDCATNQLVKQPTPPAERRYHVIGTILTVGVTEVNVLIDTTTT